MIDHSRDGNGNSFSEDMATGLLSAYESLSNVDRVKRVASAIYLAKEVEGIHEWVVTSIIQEGIRSGYSSLYTLMVDALRREESWLDEKWLRIISYLVSGEHEDLDRISGYKGRVALIAIDETRRYLESLYLKS